MKCPQLVATQEYGKKGKTRRCNFHAELIPNDPEKFAKFIEKNKLVTSLEPCTGKLSIDVQFYGGGCCCGVDSTEIKFICTECGQLNNGKGLPAFDHELNPWLNNLLEKVDDTSEFVDHMSANAKHWFDI